MSNAQNGLRANTTSWPIARAKTTREGRCFLILRTPQFQQKKADLRAFCRIRLLQEEPYNQKAAEAAVGLGTDNGSRSQEAVDRMED